MTGAPQVLAIIPARSGSKGLPGKNTRAFAGLPLIAHSILFAGMCPEITRCVVSTDSSEIAEVAKQHGGEVPFLRPTELAQDSSPLFPTLRHALLKMEELDRVSYDYVVLLDPTSPAREPADVSGAIDRLIATPSASGIVSASEPDFNPIWHCVVEKDGWMTDLIPEGSDLQRRQDVPRVLRINGALYIWRSEFVRSDHASWRKDGKHLVYEIPEVRAMSIDQLFEFERAELMVTSGLVHFPWLPGECR